MSTDRSAIEQTIQTYFDGLYEGDADKLGSIFHERRKGDVLGHVP